ARDPVRPLRHGSELTTVTPSAVRVLAGWGRQLLGSETMHTRYRRGCRGRRGTPLRRVAALLIGPMLAVGLVGALTAPASAEDADSDSSPTQTEQAGDCLLYA